MKTQRIIPGILFAALLLAAVSCGNESSKKPDDTKQTGTESETEEQPRMLTDLAEPQLPALDCGGADFTIMYRGTGSYGDTTLYSEETNGELVNDAVFRRNQAIEDHFNIRWKVIDKGTGVVDAARQSIAAGETDIDVLDTSGNSFAPLVTENYLVDLTQLPYADITKEYWNKYAAKDLSVFGHVFFMPTELSLSSLIYTNFLYYNKYLAEQNEVGDLYKLVNDGQWTLEKFFSLLPLCSSDMNGDGVYNCNDRYGMLYAVGSNSTFVHFLLGSGVNYTRQDEKYGLLIDCVTEKTQKVLDIVRAGLRESRAAIEYGDFAKDADYSSYGNYFAYGQAMFAEDHFLFMQGGLSIAMRNMEHDYGILPNPKFDESQEGYYHMADVLHCMYAVPTTNTDPERTGEILEYGSWLSHSLLIAAYYDQAVREKLVRDTESLEMLDIIRTSARYELSLLYGFKVGDMMKDAEKKGSITSSYEKYSMEINGAMRELTDAIENMEE